MNPEKLMDQAISMAMVYGPKLLLAIVVLIVGFLSLSQ
jgi:hypothetical protein